MGHNSTMCEIIQLEGPLPDAHKKAIRLLGDPMIEMGIRDGELSDDDKKMVDRLHKAGHDFQIVTFEGSDRAYLVGSN